MPKNRKTKTKPTDLFDISRFYTNRFPMPFDVDGNTYPHLSGALIDLAMVELVRFGGTDKAIVSLNMSGAFSDGFGLLLTVTAECGRALEQSWKDMRQRKRRELCEGFRGLFETAPNENLEASWEAIRGTPSIFYHSVVAFEMFCRGLLEEQQAA